MPIILSSVRVLKDLVTNGLVNGRDIRLAAPLNGDIIIDSPLSFGTVVADKLYTKHLISGIDFNAWTEKALQRWKPVPQVVTAPWHIETVIANTFDSHQGINGMENRQFLEYVYKSNERFSRKSAEKCINSTQANILSGFKNVFNINASNPINSVHLWNTFNQNYMVINAGCESHVYIWNAQNMTFLPLSTAVTGDVIQWIHVQDMNGENVLISNNDGSIDSNCAIGGAFIWRLDPNLDLLIEQVQFGRIAEFKSMQMKPNSRAFFYALRNTDNHLIEYNLRGAIITEWNVNDANAVEPNLVPGEANLGLALSHGAKLSMLTSCNCTKRTKRCSLITEKVKGVRRQHFDKVMAQFHTDLHNGRNIFRSILNANGNSSKTNLSSSLTAKRMEQLKLLVDKSTEKTSQILGAAATPSNTSATDNLSHFKIANNQSESATSTPSTDAISSNVNGKLIIHLMNAIDNAVEEKKSSTTETTTTENTIQEPDEEIIVGTGAEFVDLIDMVEKVIEENDMKHRQQDSNEYENEYVNENSDAYRVGSSLNKTEVVQMLNDSLALKELLSSSKVTNESDTQVGTLFGMFMLEQSLANTFNRATKVLLGEDERPRDEEQSEVNPFGIARRFMNRNHKKKKSGLFGSMLGSVHTNPAEHYKESVNTLQKIRNAWKNDTTDAADDVQVGDRFGDLMFKITPLADKMFDDIVDELRRRNHENYQPYRSDDSSIGSVNTEHIEPTETISSNNSRPQYKSSDVKLMMKLMDGIDEQLEQRSNDKENSDASGSILVNLLDLIDDIIQKNREQHVQNNDKYEDDENANYYNVGATLNKSVLSQMLNGSLNLHSLVSTMHQFNETNPTVGTLFGTIFLEKTIAATISKSNHSASSHVNSTSEHSNVKHILDMISKAENITLKAISREADNDDGDKVGDRFGDLMFKLTPLADDIMDKIVEELRRRQNDDAYRNDRYMVSSAHDHPAQKHENDDRLQTSKMFVVFKTISKSLVKAYIFGTKHFGKIKNLAQDLKYLYDLYYGSHQANDNSHDISTVDMPLDEVSSEEDTIGSTRNGSAKYHEDRELIYKMIPNAEEFVTAFTAEMIKHFNNGTENQNMENNQTFWTIFMNGVKAAFVMHDTNTNTEPNKNPIESNSNEKIFAKFMHDLNEMVKQLRNSSMSEQDDSVSSSNSASVSTDDPTLQDTFGTLFDKFTPLIDHLSDKIVYELQQREFSKNEHMSEPDELKSSKIQNVLNNISGTSTEVNEERSFAENPSKLECNRNITMEEIIQKLNKLKGTHRTATDIFPVLSAVNRSNDHIDESTRESIEQKNPHMEIAMVSIPNPLPSHRITEIIALTIASNQQLLVAVASVTKSNLKSDHDQIQV